MKRLILCLLLLLCGLTALGQGLHYVVRGTVTDAGTGKSMESVAVSLPGRTYATVTNSDGEYVIKSDAPINELIFTCLGYASVRKKTDGEGKLNVSMKRIAIQLDGAMVVSGNALDLVRQAIFMIPVNYPEQAELMDCFYRETIRKRQRYTYICEAVSRIYKYGYKHGVAADRTALDKSRVLLSQKRRDTLSVKLQGGPTQAVTFDIAKNPDFFIDEEIMCKHKLVLAGTDYIDGRAQFVVKVSPEAISDFALYNGTLYIDCETFAFTRAELSMDMSSPYLVTRQILVKKPAQLRFTPKEVSFIVNYRKAGDIYRLSYCRTTMRFACDWKKRLLSTNYTVVNELVVTGVRDTATPIRWQEMFSPRDVLMDKSKLFDDPDFWKDYNIIEPTESLERAIGHLKK